MMISLLPRRVFLPANFATLRISAIVRTTVQNASLETPCKYSDDQKQIMYNSVLEIEKMRMLKSSRKETMRQVKLRASESNPTMSVALKYLSETDKARIMSEYGFVNTLDPPEMESPSVDDSKQISNVLSGESSVPDFLRDFEMEDERKGEDVEDPMEVGTWDKKIPKSKVPCGGCGALLHCQDPHEPGFIPKESFVNVSDKHLRATTCQRCHYLHHYNMAMDVNVKPEDYPVILSQIKKKKALILLVVDLMDFPCSIWPRLKDIIGERHPVCVVANKVDLLPADNPHYLEGIIDSVRSQVLQATELRENNLKHVALVSAKTGYGVEELINVLHKSWEHKGDIYLVGCTNVGKSSLFNLLLQSDLCKVLASDKIQRATISAWPGTTLNLLKFPMMRANPTRKYERVKRLMLDRQEMGIEKELRKAEFYKYRNLELTTLKGKVGRTFTLQHKEKMDPFSQQSGPAHDFTPDFGLDPKHPDFRDGVWCFDTPGTFQPDQMISMLTEEELALTLPKKIISPRTYSLRPGQSLFLAGLGRIDCIRSDAKHILLTMFASEDLPITVCDTSQADKVYSEFLGTPMMAVPCGDELRLTEWCGLEPKPEPLQFTGVSWKNSCADIVLSSAGWAAVTLENSLFCEVVAHTPQARGIYVRTPALLPFAVSRRGPRIRGTPTYGSYRPLFR